MIYIIYVRVCAVVCVTNNAVTKIRRDRAWYRYFTHLCIRHDVWGLGRQVVDWREKWGESCDGDVGGGCMGAWGLGSLSLSLSLYPSLCKKKKYLQGSLKAVIINLKPLTRVPHESVTYLSVTKFVRVNITPTDCFVLLHVMSACVKTKTKQKKNTWNELIFIGNNNSNNNNNIMCVWAYISYSNV